MIARALALAAVAGCWNEPPPVNPPPPPARNVDPMAIATRLLDREIAAARNGDDNALREVFAPTAKIWNATEEYAPAELATPTAFGLPLASVTITDVKIAELHTDGSGGAVWFAADLVVDFVGPSDVTGSQRVTVSQLATAETSWRVVAAVVALPIVPRDQELRALDAKTPPGPVASLVGVPATLARALSPTAVVISPAKTKLLTGIAAGKIVAASKYSLGDVHEARSKGSGFVMAEVSGGRVFAIAIPDGAAWSVVLVHYVAH